MAMNVQLDPRYQASSEAPDLSEEEASQGQKTGHIRWVLAIGFALACLAVAGVALIQS
jgi:hypothetical protein